MKKYLVYSVIKETTDGLKNQTVAIFFEHDIAKNFFLSQSQEENMEVYLTRVEEETIS